MDTVPAATEAGAVAEQDTDNLDSQRKLEETATVAIEADRGQADRRGEGGGGLFEGGQVAGWKGKIEKDLAKLAMDAPIRVVIREGVKYGISRKRAKLGGDKYRQAHVGLFLSNAAENAAQSGGAGCAGVEARAAETASKGARGRLSAQIRGAARQVTDHDGDQRAEVDRVGEGRVEARAVG